MFENLPTPEWRRDRVFWSERAASASGTVVLLLLSAIYAPPWTPKPLIHADCYMRYACSARRRVAVLDNLLYRLINEHA